MVRLLVKRRRAGGRKINLGGTDLQTQRSSLVGIEKIAGIYIRANSRVAAAKMSVYRRDYDSHRVRGGTHRKSGK